ncbi:MAG: tryptophan-rich sensory protein [Coprobacter sp.]|nr:tryptophan-rich sensory protein [Coprobacter sp.]
MKQEVIIKTITASIIGVVLCMLIGLISGYIQSYSLTNWYPYLNRSSLSPPNYIFPIAWGIIYILNGISLGIIWGSNLHLRNSGVMLFTIQLALNFLWSILFFYMQSPMLGFINIFILDIALLLYMKRCYDIKKTAFWLNVPNMVWLLFATYLNLYVVVYN